jgi:asparagine synthase (glutamine-hydrolysing)
MRLFTMLLDPNDRGIGEDVRRSYEALPRRRGLEFEWLAFDHAAVLTAWDDPWGEPLVAKVGSWLGAGMVRLDNRGEVERWTECDCQSLSDLEVVLRVVARCGTRYIPHILGDFAFVVWTSPNRTAVAAADAFAAQRLYRNERQGLLVFGSRADALTNDHNYDKIYLAELLSYCPPSNGRSVYADVSSVPAATVLTFSQRQVAQKKYWSAHDFEPHQQVPQSETVAVEACHALMTDAVTARLTNSDGMWAQLSGGIDSSSIVSLAQWRHESGRSSASLGGTVTWVDHHGTGADERQYSDSVIKRYRIPNELIDSLPLWCDDGLPPPLTDQPAGLYPFYARDRSLVEAVRRNGGRCLLTGRGGDELFAGNMFFFADWVAAGRIVPAMREMRRRAAIGRVSFWELAYKNALLPLVVGPLRRKLIREEGQVPRWVSRSLVKSLDLSTRACAPMSYSGRFGRKYADARATIVDAIPASLSTGVIEEGLDVRHPYLYRPLVEFALRLSPELCVRPYARKWVLREAMRGILPEEVRTRVGKGLLYGAFAWSMVGHQDQLSWLIQDSMLGQLGIVDTRELQVASSKAKYERDSYEKLSVDVQYTLAIEAWLRVRSGVWRYEGSTKSIGRISNSTALLDRA